MNRDMLSRRLVRKGYDVAIAFDGAQGVSMTTKEKPDLILMDMSLPVMDGWTATKQIKADPKTQTIPVIALTAHAMTGDREKALAAGCDEYDTKPIQFKRLLGKISSLLEKPTNSEQQEDQEIMNKSIKNHEDLAVYQIAFNASMKIFEISKKFPEEEKYSLTDRIRLSSRLVCINLAEAFIKSDDRAAFVAKLSDSEAEAARTKTWIQFAFKCNYLPPKSGRELYTIYNRVLNDLTTMIKNPSTNS